MMEIDSKEVTIADPTDHFDRYWGGELCCRRDRCQMVELLKVIP